MEQKGFSRAQISSAIGWKYGERILAQGVNLLIQIVLARCLEPALFGQLAILLVFVNYATIFVQSGISTYIIQKDNLQDEDISTALFITLSMSAIMYVLIYFSASYIEEYYNYEGLCKFLRVMAISLIPSAICSVFQGLLIRKMAFRTIFIRSLLAVPVSGIVGIVMAQNGFGLWALVFQHIINQAMTCVVLAVGSHQRLRLRIAWGKIRGILDFGGNILIQSLLTQFLESIRTLLIGKVYSSEELAYYDKGQTYTTYLYTGVGITLANVLLPTLTKVQNDKKDMKKIAKRFLSMSGFLMTPLLVGVGATASSWVPILLTEKWNAAIPYVAIFCLAKIPAPVVTINLQIYYSLAKVRTTRNLVSLEFIISIVILLITYRISTLAIAWGFLIVAVIDAFLFSVPSAKLIDYSTGEQIKDILPSLINACVMYVMISLIEFLPVGRVTILALQIVVGGIIYIGIAAITKNQSFEYLRRIIVDFVKQKYQRQG